MHGKSAHCGAWSLFAGLALVGLLLVGACAKHVPQDKATGSDGKIKGARPIELDNGEAKVRGIVTYPGGDRIDWRSIELPKDQVGTLSLKLSWVAPRPGLSLAVDVFDEWGKQVASERGGKRKSNRRSRSADIENARGKYLIRVYAPFRGDAGKYTLKVSFTQAVAEAAFDWRQVEIPDPPRLAAVPAAEVPCDIYNFDRKNPACATMCPQQFDPSWPGCADRCPNPPDINNPKCWGSMPCPTPPDRRVKACRAEDFPPCDPDRKDPKNPNCDNFKVAPVRGKIINVQAATDGTIVTINRGEDKKIAPGWTGRLLRPNGKPVEGSDFKIIKVTKREAVGKVRLNTDTVNNNRDVELEAP